MVDLFAEAALLRCGLGEMKPLALAKTEVKAMVVLCDRGIARGISI